MKKNLVCSLLMVILFWGSAAQAQFDDKFYFPQKEWEKMDSVKYEEIFVTMNDSARLNAVFLKPSGIPVATIFYFHGAGGNLTSYIGQIKPFVDNGFQVFMADFRGYGRSGGDKPTHLNIAADAGELFAYLQQRKDVKGTKLVLMGVSMGAAAAAHLAVEHRKEIQGLVLEGGISSFTDIALQGAAPEMQPVISAYVGSPYAPKEDVKLLAGLPKLIIHSTEDKEVFFAQGKQVYENAAEPKSFWEIKGSHLQAAILYPQEICKRIGKLIAK